MLILTFVLLILGWLRVFDPGFATILIVSTRYLPLLNLTLTFMSSGQISLTSMITCAARFSIFRLFRAFAARFFRAPTGPNDDKLDITNQKVCESGEGMRFQCSGTSSGTRPGTGQDIPSFSLSERGVMPEDGRMLYDMITNAMLNNSGNWNSFS